MEEADKQSPNPEDQIFCYRRDGIKNDAYLKCATFQTLVAGQKCSDCEDQIFWETL